jgi:hypothetical protein
VGDLTESRCGSLGWEDQSTPSRENGALQTNLEYLITKREVLKLELRKMIDKLIIHRKLNPSSK